VQFHIAIGEGVEVTPEIRDAIERLLSQLQEPDVEGFRKCDPKCPSLGGCGEYICGRLHNCQPLTQTPQCAVHYQCAIAGFLG
jgi:hypothetical protein